MQGLPALERLLFSEGAGEADFAGSPEAEFRCRLGSAIAANILAIAQEVQAGWVDGDNAIAKRLAAPEIAGGLKAALATDLLGAYVLIKDKKLDPAMGKDPADTRPKMAEGWRSGRSLRAIAAQSGVHRRHPEDPRRRHAQAGQQRAAQQRHRAARCQAPQRLISASLAAGPQRRDLILLRDAADAAGKRAFEEVPFVLGVTVGFNSLDGD